MNTTPNGSGPSHYELGKMAGAVKAMAESVKGQAETIENMRKEFHEHCIDVNKQFSELNRYTLFDVGKVSAAVLTVWTGVLEGLRAVLG